jgi:hypothetical protein
MKFSRKTLASLILIFTLLFSSLFSFSAYADDEEITEEPVVEDSTPVVKPKVVAPGGLVAHWKFDGNLKDSTQFKNDGVGKITYVDAILVQGAKFDGKSFIEVKDSDSLDLTDAFTISLWVYKDDMRTKTNQNQEPGVSFITKLNDEYKSFPYALRQWWPTKPGVFITGEEGEVESFTEAGYDVNKWVLLTATFKDSTVKIYYNNEQVKSEPVETTTVITSSKNLLIGFSNFMNSDNYFKGIMDDLRIYNEALDQKAIIDLYDAGLAGNGKNLLSKPKKMVAFYKFDGNGKDLSGFNNNADAIDANGGIKYVDGLAGKAAKFNGASYFEVQDNDYLDFDTNFTLAAWIYKEKNTTQPIITKYGDIYNKKEASYSWTDLEAWGQSIALSDFLDDNSQISTFSSKATPTGNWRYYTVAFDGSTVKLYVDNALVKSENFPAVVTHSTLKMWIGATEDTFFKGMMDEVRLYNYTMTGKQIGEIYKLRDTLSITQAGSKISVGKINAGQSKQLKVDLKAYKYTPSNLKNTNGKDSFVTTTVTTTAKYESSNTKVFTVTKAGKVTAVGKGKATLTVKYAGLVYPITITV